jgi:hypothetical protein
LIAIKKWGLVLDISIVHIAEKDGCPPKLRNLTNRAANNVRLTFILVTCG